MLHDSVQYPYDDLMMPAMYEIRIEFLGSDPETLVGKYLLQNMFQIF
jgi:hypothetical protein